jgi:hypothetical protein
MKEIQRRRMTKAAGAEAAVIDAGMAFGMELL